MRDAKLGMLIAACASVLVATTVGCGPNLPNKIRFDGQSATLQSGTKVNLQDAWVGHNIFKVKLWLQNLTDAVMEVDRDGFALRLPDGRVLRRAHGMTVRHTPYFLAPSAGRDVFVDFRDPGQDMRQTINAASLIVGGISFSTDPRQRVVGEIPLVSTGSNR